MADNFRRQVTDESSNAPYLPEPRYPEEPITAQMWSDLMETVARIDDPRRDAVIDLIARTARGETIPSAETDMLAETWAVYYTGTDIPRTDVWSAPQLRLRAALSAVQHAQSAMFSPNILTWWAARQGGDIATREAA